MPYRPEHKQETRQRVIECARALFNQRGFNEVTIDEIMAAAGLTRGGFYNLFKAKDELYVEVWAMFANARMAEMDDQCSLEMARHMLTHYISRQHIDNVNGQCPLMALSGDVARSGERVRSAYHQVLLAMTTLFERSLKSKHAKVARKRALGLAAVSVGAMVLARTVNDEKLADDICAAARDLAFDTLDA